MTMLIATHDVAFARAIADRVVFLQDGVIADEGTAEEILDNPHRPETRRFLNLINTA
jgi:ABC-type polar amino acid transport system ATPase subunit